MIYNKISNIHLRRFEIIDVRVGYENDADSNMLRALKLFFDPCLQPKLGTHYPTHSIASSPYYIRFLTSLCSIGLVLDRVHKIYGAFLIATRTLHFAWAHLFLL